MNGIVNNLITRMFHLKKKSFYKSQKQHLLICIPVLSLRYSLPVCMFVFLCICLSVCMFVWFVCVCQRDHRTAMISLSKNWMRFYIYYTYMCFYLFVCLFACLSVCLSKNFIMRMISLFNIHINYT